MKKTHGRRRGRRLLTALLLCAAGVLFFLSQQNWIQTETIEVWSDRLPAAFDRLRIVQISDLHGKEYGEDSCDLIDAVRGLQPDLIVITGDLIDKRPGQLDMVPALAAGLSTLAPTYYVTGNHEWTTGEISTLISTLEEHGVTPLRGAYEVLERDGQSLVLAGIDDPNGLRGQKTEQELIGEIRAAQGDPFLLLLAHRNGRVDIYRDAAPDLVLAGHAHGGMVRLPFTDGLIGPHHEFLPQYTAGLYTLSPATQMVVSRGLGSGTWLQIRLFNRPHLPVIVLRSGAQ